MNTGTFAPKFKPFEYTPERFNGDEIILLHHHFGPLEAEAWEKRKIYDQSPWRVEKIENGFLYTWISALQYDGRYYRQAVFNKEHTKCLVYNDTLRKEAFEAGGLGSLTMFPTDQILLARLLADRCGCMVHSSAVIMDGEGYLFVGHSDAGKSTMVELLREHGEILCDDRNIVRLVDGEWRLYGTWSHGDVADVSGRSAPLKGIYFLNQSQSCRLVPMADRSCVAPRLLACLVKPLLTVDWWEKTFGVIAELIRGVPAYDLYFDRTGGIFNCLTKG